MPDRTIIGIAMVESMGGLLVGIRPHNCDLGGYTEFPGGKCDAHELPRDCAVRECAEETGVDVVPVCLIEQIEWDYPHGQLELHFWLCVPQRGQPRAPFRWVDRAEIEQLRFPPANASAIAQWLARVRIERSEAPLD